MIPGWVELGKQTEVALDEIVAVHEGCSLRDYNKMAAQPATIDNIRATVVLRNGTTMPVYITIETLRRRIQTMVANQLAATAKRRR